MKPPATSEMVFNVLKHEFPRAGMEGLLQLSEQLQQTVREKSRRFSWAANPDVTKQKLSKTVLKSMRPQPAAGPKEDQS